MPEKDYTTFRATIETLIAKIKRYQSRPLGEQNTKASLIEPLLEALGWDVRDADEVHHEYKARSKDKPVDYALQMLRKPRLFIEAKGLGENIGDRKWISQILGYATVAGVTWCVLTDGDEYRFYNANAPVDADEKLFCKVKLSDGLSDRHVRTLDLISRSNIEGNLLDQFWDAHFVDRRVNGVLRQLVTTADRGLVRLIRRNEPKLTAREIGESILRHDIQIDSPQAWNVAKNAQPPQSVTLVPRAAKKNPKRDGKRQDFGVKLSEIITAGALSAPMALFRKYKGKVLQATMHKDGTVEFQGERFSTCSRAGDKARSTVTGRQMNTNGWRFWQYTDATGKNRELDYAREIYLANTRST